MRALVVYESMFGNTEQLARSIATALDETLPTVALEVGATPIRLPADIGLLIVGAPTHALGLSRYDTRQHARVVADEAGLTLSSTGSGVREWLTQLVPATIEAAVFDTSIDASSPAQASRPVVQALRRLGFHVRDHRSFQVGDVTGPLRNGELDRAEDWARSLVFRENPQHRRIVEGALPQGWTIQSRSFDSTERGAI